MRAGTPATLFEKIWSSHVVTEGPGGHALLYIDRHLLHEGSTHAFHRMARNGSRMRRPDLSFATADHYVLTTPGTPTADAERDRKSTRLNSSHRTISYAVFCLKKKKQN